MTKLIRRKTPQSNASGFTLIELLVSIAIASIIAALSVPIFNQYSQRAGQVQALNDFHNMEVAAQALHSDYDFSPASGFGSAEMDCYPAGGYCEISGYMPGHPFEALIGTYNYEDLDQVFPGLQINSGSWMLFIFGAHGYYYNHVFNCAGIRSGDNYLTYRGGSDEALNQGWAIGYSVVCPTS